MYRSHCPLNWVGLASLAFLLAAPLVYGQGSLTPPGAPAPTMKTLQQVFDAASAAGGARLPIKQADLPLSIASPGSYLLAEPLELSATDTDAITILTSGTVTIDLNGFALVGPGADQGATGDGIVVEAGSAVTLAVLNGSVEGFRGDGIDSDVALGSKILGVCALDNGGNGIAAGDSALIAGCTANGNAGNGIQVGSGGSILDSIASANGMDGISVLSNCLIRGNTCDANGNGDTADELGAGITALDFDNRVEGNSCTNNDFGILVGLVGDGVTSNGNLVSGNSCSSNLEGITVNDGGNVIVKNSLMKNGGSVTDNIVDVGGNLVGTEESTGVTTNPLANLSL